MLISSHKAKNSHAPIWKEFGVMVLCCLLAHYLYKKVKNNLRNVTMMRPAVAGVDKRSKSSRDPIIASLITISKVTPDYNRNPQHCLVSGTRSPVWKKPQQISVFCPFWGIPDPPEPDSCWSTKSLHKPLLPGSNTLCFSRLNFPKLLTLFIKDGIEFKEYKF